MTVFTYNDYLICKKILYRLPLVFREESTPYYALAPNEKVSDVHDKLYRDLLNDKKEFSLFLKYFLNYDIPADSLEKYNNTFITNDFQNRRSDIVYKIRNEPTYIFVEHQSSIDYSISYRIFDYYANLLKDTVDVSKIKTKKYKMPSIIPILLYSRTYSLGISSQFTRKTICK